MVTMEANALSPKVISNSKTIRSKDYLQKQNVEACYSKSHVNMHNHFHLFLSNAIVK